MCWASRSRHFYQVDDDDDDDDDDTEDADDDFASRS